MVGTVVAQPTPDTISRTFVALTLNFNRTVRLMSFTWIPIYSEIAREVLKFEERQSELLSLLSELRADGLKVILLTDRDADGNEMPLAEIDPFTFFASFNRHNSLTGRQAILARIKDAWQLSAPVPDDFDGIPTANPQNSWTFSFFADRTPNDIPISLARRARGRGKRLAAL